MKDFEDLGPVEAPDFEDVGPIHYKMPRESRVDPLVLDKFSLLAKDFYDKTGEPLKVTDSFRTYEEQVDLKKRKPKLAATPGKSRHEVGAALDVDQNQIAKFGLDNWSKLLDSHGFVRPALSKGETWHIELPRMEKAEKIAAVTPKADFEDLGPVEVEDLGPVATEASFNPTKEQAEQAAKASGVAVEPGLTEPTFLEPTNLLGAGGGLVRSLGLKGLVKALPGMLTGEVTSGLTSETLEGKVPEYVRIPATIAADIAGGMGAEKLLRRRLPMIAPSTPYPAVEIGERSAKLSEIEDWMSSLRVANQPAYERLADLNKAGQKSASFAGAAGVPSSNVLTAEQQAEAEMLKNWLGVRGKRLESLAGERNTLFEEIQRLKGKPVVEPVQPMKVRPTTGTPDPTKLSPPTEDIDPKILGSFSTETKPFLFDRIDRAAPGSKDAIYWRQKELEKTGLEEVQRLEDISREWESALPKGSSKAIMVNAIANQKGGPEVLKSMGITDIPKLTPEQTETLGKFRSEFDRIFHLFNAARMLAGKDPIKKVDNYFTFFRQLNEANKAGMNPLRVDKNFFDTTVVESNFAKRRGNSDEPLVTDAFKVFRNYARGVIPWIHQAPHHKDVLDYARSIEDKAPNMAAALDRWVGNIQGTGIPKPLGQLEAPVRKLTNNISVATLGGYVRSALTQPASLVGSAAELGPKYLFKGIGQSLNPERVNFALENSKVLKTREFDVSITDSIERMVNDTITGKIKRGAVTASYMPLQAIDAKAAQATWLGAYDRAISKGIDEPIRYADSVVLKTQGSAAKSDIADIQTHALGKFMTMFQTFVINDFNYIAKDLMGIKNPDITKGEQLRKVINYVVAATMANSAADAVGFPTPLPSPISAMKLESEKPSSRGLDVAKAGVLELAQKLPVVGGAARFGGSIGGPGATFIERSLKGQESLPFAAAKILGVPFTNQLQRLMPIMTGDVAGDTMDWKDALVGKTAEQYEQERKSKKPASSEKLFLKGLREPADTAIEDLLEIMGGK